MIKEKKSQLKLDNYTIYIHISPSNKVYIGQTKRNVKQRWHNGNGYKENNPAFYKAILKYGWDNIEHKILFENITSLDADMIEEDLIFYYKKENKSYNITDGGKGVKGVAKSKEVLSKMRDRMTGDKNPFYGKTHSDETKQHLSKIRKGKIPWNKGLKMSEELIKKNSESHKGIMAGDKNGMYGKHRTEEEKAKLSKLHSKIVYQYTKDGIFIAEYPSCKIAAKVIGVKSYSHISACAQGKEPYAHGFLWKYKITN